MTDNYYSNNIGFELSTENFHEYFASYVTDELRVGNYGKRKIRKERKRERIGDKSKFLEAYKNS